MKRHTPLLLACAILSSNVPSVRPFAVSSGRRLVRSAGHRHGPSAAQNAAEPLRPNNMKMSNPSTPVPRNIKDTVSCLRAAVQEGLQAQRSRMDVDLPFAARLGVETADADKDKKKYTDADVERADRELARLFLEMFDVIGDQVVVAFPTDEGAKKATKVWNKGMPFKGKVTCMDPRPPKGPKLKRGSTSALAGFASQVEASKKAKGKGKKGGKQGGGGGGGADDGRTPATARIAPTGTEVLLVVAPKQAELRAVQKISKELGQGCLIILLNARLHQAKFVDDEQREYFEQEFESMFHLRPVAAENEDFLYRAYPKDWTVARKPKLGPPKVLSAQEKRPTEAEILAAVEEGDKAAGVFGKIF
ncbi:unnamed protein product [Scytosiphon promiscuus]